MHIHSKFVYRVTNGELNLHIVVAGNKYLFSVSKLNATDVESPYNENNVHL